MRTHTSSRKRQMYPMNKTSSTLIPAHVYGANGPAGAHAPKHVVEVPSIDPEISHNRPKMLGTHVQVPALNRCPATLTHAVRETLGLLNLNCNVHFPYSHSLHLGNVGGMDFLLQNLWGWPPGQAEGSCHTCTIWW